MRGMLRLINPHQPEYLNGRSDLFCAQLIVYIPSNVYSCLSMAKNSFMSGRMMSAAVVNQLAHPFFCSWQHSNHNEDKTRGTLTDLYLRSLKISLT